MQSNVAPLHLRTPRRSINAFVVVVGGGGGDGIIGNKRIFLQTLRGYQCSRPKGSSSRAAWVHRSAVVSQCACLLLSLHCAGRVYL